MTNSIDEFLGAAKAPRLSVTINARADLLERHAQLQAEHDQAQREDLRNAGLVGGSRAPVVMEQIHAVEDEMSASEWSFVFEGLGHHKYMRLLAAHPPRKTDKSNGLDFNADTFPPALMAACAVDPEMSEEQAKQLCEQVTDGQFSKLWNVAIGVNVARDDTPKSARRSATGERNATSSNTAPPEESLAASSSDG